MGMEDRMLLKLGLRGTGYFLFLLSFLNILASIYVDGIDGVIDFCMTSIILSIIAAVCCIISIRL